MPVKRKVARRKKASKKKATTKKRATKKAPAKKKTARRKKTSKKAAAKPAQAKADNVVEIRRYTELSITQISLDTGITRKTIRKRLAEAGVQQARLERGYPVYRLKDILPALYQESDGVTDPDKLRPFERRAYYQGEHDKLKLQQDRGELVPSFEVERAFAALFKTVTQRLDTLPDILEREAAIQGHALVIIEQTIDELRELLYREIIDSNPDADSADEKRA